MGLGNAFVVSRPSEVERLERDTAVSASITVSLRSAVERAALHRGLPAARLASLRLFSAELAGRRSRPASATPSAAAGVEWPGRPVELDPRDAPRRIGELFETLLERSTNRKRSGSFFTPAPLAARVVAAALERWQRPLVELSACDPALGGGAFLLALGTRILEGSGAPDTPAMRRRIVEHCLKGVDVSPLAVAVSEAVLWLWAGDDGLDPRALRNRLRVADALERGWERALLGERSGFDLVLGNPPWVAFAGRAAKPLTPSERKRLAREYSCFRGYPTLHGMFVERATELAKDGVIALLLPSPVADLDGYRPVRSVMAQSHTPREPLLELGQDAFEGVTQPCFALVADPGPQHASARPWRLVERQRACSSAAEVLPPAVLERIAALPSFPRELFGEMGFQSAGEVSKTLFRRGDAPDGQFEVPLLEGREVREFRVGPPRLFLWPEPNVLARARCRLRDAEQYRRVPFIVRQTAKYPIAALHTGLPFRNSLLAGFHHPELPPSLVVALLNSSLYRALHLAVRRDARQAAFPQVKVAHLRALPRPPRDDERWRELEELSGRASRQDLTPALRGALDERVFELFGLSALEREATLAFLHSRAPELSPERRASLARQSRRARAEQLDAS